MREDFLFLPESEHDASTDHIVRAGVVNLALPINLLDGLRWGGAVFMVLLLLVPLEALLWRQFSWMKASLLFVFHFPFFFS